MFRPDDVGAAGREQRGKCHAVGAQGGPLLPVVQRAPVDAAKEVQQLGEVGEVEEQAVREQRWAHGVAAEARLVHYAFNILSLFSSFACTAQTTHNSISVALY